MTNITRDQPARNNSPESVFNAIKAALDDKMNLVINADDPILNRVKLFHKGQITTYGIAKTKYDTQVQPNYSVDAAYCPNCHTKLKYTSYHYGHIGLYSCPNCDFARNPVNYEAKNLDLENGTFKIDNDSVVLNKKVFFAAYYTLAAYTLAREIGLDKKAIIKSIDEHKNSSKRMKEYEIENRSLEMLESKNENALSYLQSLNYIRDAKGKKTVIMGFENVSRRYEYNDLSWLWDVDFELLNDESIDKIFCIGRFKYDVKTRLEYANIDTDKIVLIDDMSTLIDRVLSESTGNIYTMVCFDMTAIIKDLLKERIHEKEN